MYNVCGKFEKEITREGRQFHSPLPQAPNCLATPLLGISKENQISSQNKFIPHPTPFILTTRYSILKHTLMNAFISETVSF